MSKRVHIPELRFKEFSGEWEEKRLDELMSRHSENNKDEEFGLNDILSLSSKYGIVDRKELLEETYSKVNHRNYIKTRLNDFVYGKSISASYPYGLFKANQCRDGLLSTLYFTFKIFENVSLSYLDSYFSYHNRANNFLRKYVLVGDRYITANSDYILSGKIFIPQKPEQQKIASFLTTIDTEIEQLTKKVELQEQYKKGVMQKIFSREIRFKNDDGSEFEEWKWNKLGNLCKLQGGYAFKSSNFQKQGIPIIRISNISNKNNFIDTNNIVYYKELKNDDNFTIKYGNLLIAMSGATTGKASIYNLHRKSYLNQRVGLFKTNKKLIYDYLIQFVFSKQFSKQLDSVLVTGAQPNISSKDIENFNINLPSLEEQNKIANFLSTLDKQINFTKAQLTKIKEFKKGLLQRMFV